MVKQFAHSAPWGFIIALVLLPSAAQADEVADKCIGYANTAVKQYQQAMKNNCGFSGPRWSNSTPHHYDWCIRGDNHKRASGENNWRAQQLSKCKNKGAGSQGGSISNKCVEYANTAVKQYQQAMSKNCGFSGPRWSNDTAHHYNWCIRGDNPKRANGENNWRAQQLKKCK